jgi:integration host factor subunit alpha
MSVTRATLIDAVLQEVGLSRVECRRLVDQTFGEVSAALMRGEPVGISRFGRFRLVQKAQRAGSNPKTGEGLVVRPRRVLMFRASKVLKAKVARAPVIARERT